MNRALRTVGITVAFLALLLLALRTFGVDPRDQRPGLWLSGEPAGQPVSDWSFTDEHEEIHVQTSTWYGIPHSVTTYCATYEGDLYLFSAYYEGGPFPDTRRWNVNVMRDPRIRLKIGDRLYDQRAEHVSDETVRQAVIGSFERKYPEWTSPGDGNVHVFRVRPRESGAG